MTWSAGDYILAGGTVALVGLGVARLRGTPGASCKYGGSLAGVEFIVAPGTTGRPPAVIFHGRGGGPKGMRDLTRGVARGAQLWPRGIERKANAKHGLVWFQARSKEPEFEGQLRAALPTIAAFLAEVVRCYGKPIVAGYSQGAHVAYALASQYPELVLRVVAASGALPESMWGTRFAVPVDAIHGTADTTVPYGRTAAMAAAKGAQLWPIEGAGHGFTGSTRATWNALLAGA